MSIRFKMGRMLGGAAILALLAPAAAFAGDRVGTLQCKLLGNGLSVLVENQQIDCMYNDDAEGVAPAHYTGTLTKVGPNVTINGQGELAWGVIAATGKVGPGALAGNYVGPNVSAKIGVGGGGAVLVGGSDNTFSLQPFQIEAGAGIGWNAGVESLALTFVPPPPPPPPPVPHKRHRHHH
ncbi:DUF992 domain-containing protein [Methylocystis sp. JAN1]|uniref:DUF992 domain-containing protein n=1 Tax=Methylocystis sp. JAN1 TaxID=3397211 RepID=UPI003FA1D268